MTPSASPTSRRWRRDSWRSAARAPAPRTSALPACDNRPVELRAADSGRQGAAEEGTGAFETRIRAEESDRLSPLATPSYPALLALPEPPCGIRTPFQRDRDRIVHSKSFRRL